MHKWMYGCYEEERNYAEIMEWNYSKKYLNQTFRKTFCWWRRWNISPEEMPCITGDL